MVFGSSIVTNEAPGLIVSARARGSICPAPRTRRQIISASQLTEDGFGATALRILHAYKIYRPDIEGGIPAVMSSLAQGSDQNISHSILMRTALRHWRINTNRGRTGRSRGIAGHAVFNTARARIIFRRSCDAHGSADVVIHHAPLPLNDVAILLGLPDDVALSSTGTPTSSAMPLLKRLVTPLIRRVLARADQYRRFRSADDRQFGISQTARRKMRRSSLRHGSRLLAHAGCRRAQFRQTRSGDGTRATLWRSAASSVTRATTC